MEGTREIIKKFNIRPTKSLGQNFLNDSGIIKKIVDAAGIGRDDIVIEVGPGTGAMTREIAPRCYRLVAVEIDRHLIPVLEANLREFNNTTVLNKDILDVDFGKGILQALNLDEEPDRHPVRVAANLPYYITTPIIMKFLEETQGIEAMVFMVQKEVADRMMAAPGGKEYGALSVAVQYYAEVERVLNVPPHCFIPQPEVESTVVRLLVRKTPPVDVKDKNQFFKVVKAAFGQRRKTLVNALSNSGYFGETKDQIKEILLKLGIGENQRGETLSIMQFAELSNLFTIRK